MLKKMVRMGLPLAVALGLVLPAVSAQEPQKTEKTKKKTDKSKRTGKGERRKTEEPKQQ